MGSSEEIEELWIHRALNVGVNDQSQLAELEKRGRRKERDRVMDKRKIQEWRVIKGGNIFRLIFPFPQPQLAAIKPSILCPHKGHSSH